MRKRETDTKTGTETQRLYEIGMGQEIFFNQNKHIRCLYIYLKNLFHAFISESISNKFDNVSVCMGMHKISSANHSYIHTYTYIQGGTIEMIPKSDSEFYPFLKL